MFSEFSVDSFAMHLVDRHLPGPKYCKKRLTMGDLKDPDDQAVLLEFFTHHLLNMWTVEEGKRTRGAVFDPGSMLQTCYTDISTNPDCFYSCSCAIADHLHEKSHSTTASTGILMILWVRKTGDPSPYLALLKLDPSPSDLVGLESTPDGAMLLDLVIHHIDLTLPSTNERVLKWAVLPHPTRENLDVKVRDEQGRPDMAKYFMDFAGCSERPTQKDQANGLLISLADTAAASHPGLVVQPVVQEIVDKLAVEKAVTSEVVVEKVKETRKLPNFTETAFKASLKEHQADELNVPGKLLSKTKVEYRLANGITIRGPWAQIENLLKIQPVAGGGHEFSIQTTSYEKKYV